MTSSNVGTVRVAFTNSRLCSKVRIWFCPYAARHINVAATVILFAGICGDGGRSLGWGTGYDKIK